MSALKHLGATVTKADAGTWTAIASAPTLDRDGEVVAPFAFAREAPLPASVPVHDGHDSARAIGRAVPRYHARGVLRVDGRFSSVPEAQRVRTLVREGVIDSMSIAFHNPKRENKSGVPTIVSGELLSVDFVSVPSNRDALVTSVRGFGRSAPSVDVFRARVAALQAELALLPPEPRPPLKHIYRELADVQMFLALTPPDD